MHQIEERVREIIREELARNSEMHEWYSSDEAAAYLKISRGQVHNLVTSGRLPRYGEKGQALRFRREDLDAYVEGRWSR